MTFMDVHLTGLNDRNEEVATVFAFWWDGAALRRVLKDKLIDADPPPSWRGTFTSTDLKAFAEHHPNVWQSKRTEFNSQLLDLFEMSSKIEVLIQEG